MAKTDSEKKVLTVKSGGWTGMGSSFKIKVPATPAGGGLYKIDKKDWDSTIGPMFDRMSADLLQGGHASTEFFSASHGYEAMTSEQSAAFHTLMQCFGASANMDRLTNLPGNAETNPHYARVQDFVKTLYTDQAVLVSRTQLQGLVNAARRSIEYSQESREDVTDTAREFYRDYLKENRKQVSYGPGLINRLT